jgi:hypothetical protein
MRRMAACALGGALLAAILCTGPRAWAQQTEAAEQQKAADFVQLYERLQRASEPEEKITLAERAIALEAALTRWPLSEAREFVRGELSSRAAYAYMTRKQGDRADNLEKAIAHYETALQREPVTRSRTIGATPKSISPWPIASVCAGTMPKTSRRQSLVSRLCSQL